MTTINLRDFYPWYTQDEFVDVPDIIAEELFADRRYQKTHKRIVRRYKVHSLDLEDGTMVAASVRSADRLDEVLEMQERYCRLCHALNSLSEIQGRRIEAHFLLGMSRKEIAEAEGVCENSVNVAIKRGLVAMKKYLQNFCEGVCFRP